MSFFFTKIAFFLLLLANIGSSNIASSSSSNSVYYYCPEGFSLTDQQGNNAQQYPNACQDNTCFTLATSLSSPINGMVYGCLGSSYTIPVGNQSLVISLSSSNCGTSYNTQGLLQNATITCKNLPSCFAGDSLVETMDRGVISISDIEQGDYLRAFDTRENKLIFSKFVTFSHADKEMLTRFVELKTQNDIQLKISDYHLIMTKQGSSHQFVYAKELKNGDFVLVGNAFERIVDINHNVLELGAFSPLTEHGTIVVNNVTASCYSSFRSHHVAHIVFPYLNWITQWINNVLFNYKDSNQMMYDLGLFDLIRKMPLMESFILV